MFGELQSEAKTKLLADWLDESKETNRMLHKLKSAIKRHQLFGSCSLNEDTSQQLVIKSAVEFCESFVHHKNTPPQFTHLFKQALAKMKSNNALNQIIGAKDFTQARLDLALHEDNQQIQKFVAITEKFQHLLIQTVSEIQSFVEFEEGLQKTISSFESHVLQEFIRLRKIMTQDEEQKLQIQRLADRISKLCWALSHEIKFQFLLPEITPTLSYAKRDQIIQAITRNISDLNEIIRIPIRTLNAQKGIQIRLQNPSETPDTGMLRNIPTPTTRKVSMPAKSSAPTCSFESPQKDIFSAFTAGTIVMDYSPSSSSRLSTKIPSDLVTLAEVAAEASNLRNIRHTLLELDKEKDGFCEKGQVKINIENNKEDLANPGAPAVTVVSNQQKSPPKIIGLMNQQLENTIGEIQETEKPKTRSITSLEGKLTKTRQINQCGIIIKGKTCSAKFHLQSNLKRHMRMHSESIAHSCETCGKCFTRKDNLLQHKRRACEYRKVKA